MPLPIEIEKEQRSLVADENELEKEDRDISQNQLISEYNQYLNSTLPMAENINLSNEVIKSFNQNGNSEIK